MRQDGLATRQRIIDAAIALTLEFGFGGTAIEDVVKKAGITKGAFFYHFKSKDDLAQAMVDFYIAADKAHTQTAVDRAEKLSRDPLQQILIILGLFIEQMEALSSPVPGCLYASYCYQAGLMSERNLDAVKESFAFANRLMKDKIAAAVDLHKPARPIDVDALADQLMVVFEGSFILSKVMGDAKAVARQLALMRDAIEALFGLNPAAEPKPAR